MTTAKAPNYTKEQEKALKAAFKHHATMTDDEKRKLVSQFADDIGKSTRSIISKLSVLGLWTAYKPKVAKSVKKEPTRAERVRSIQAQLGLSRDTLSSLERALASDLVTLMGAIENVRQASKAHDADTSEAES